MGALRGSVRGGNRERREGGMYYCIINHRSTMIFAHEGHLITHTAANQRGEITANYAGISTRCWAQRRESTLETKGNKSC